MRRIRVIPVLLLNDSALVKTIRFDKPAYVGDPVNAIKIYNEKEVDELAFLDIRATVSNQPPAYDKIREIASECFMPLSYGGGIGNLDQVKRIFDLGVEKVILNTAAFTTPELITDAAKRYGSQSIVASIDVRKNFLGKYRVYTHSGKNSTGRDPVECALAMQEQGAGELLVHSIERDGTYEGYDIALISAVTNAVDIPVIACGGAGKPEDFYTAVNEGGASATGAGSLFVFHGEHRAVLINFPSQDELAEKLYNKL